MRHVVFLDCGGHNGSSVRKFRARHDPQGRFNTYTFEPNPKYATSFAGLPNHELIQAAVSNADGTAEFFLDREDGDGSTLFRNKLTRDNGGCGALDTTDPVVVKTIDLSRWIQAELHPDDPILLKLDIEGAEYDTLEKLILDGTLHRVKHLFVEWHWWKIGIPQDRHAHVLGALNAAGISVAEWDAAGY
jgi:FkbM family methyltransferase